MLERSCEGVTMPTNQDHKTKNEHARALGSLGGQRGGPARSAALDPEERRAIAKLAATSRWQKLRDASDTHPHATHAGLLGFRGIPCAVLDDGRRVLTQDGMLE